MYVNFCPSTIQDVNKQYFFGKGKRKDYYLGFCYHERPTALTALAASVEMGGGPDWVLAAAS